MITNWTVLHERRIWLTIRSSLSGSSYFPYTTMSTSIIDAFPCKIKGFTADITNELSGFLYILDREVEKVVKKPRKKY